MSATSALGTPYPGFRPFRPDEAEWFFGRDEAAMELAERLGDTSFVAVLGASGSGKSSLVECGLRPLLERGLVGDAGARWRVVRMRPLNDPIGELAESLADPDLFDWPDGPIPAEQLVEAMLRRSSRGLLDVADRARLHERENLLIFVDQFEELFRYTSKIAKPKGKRDDITFVELLLRAASATRGSIEEFRAHVSDTQGETRESTGPAKIVETPELANRVFVLLTMRSDYLGDCTRYHNLTRWVNDGFYLVPFLDRPQLREVIEGPAAAFRSDSCPNGVEFEARLVHRILNDVGDEPAMLPVLQHALMRMWNARKPGVAEIVLGDYRGVGGLKNALNDHLKSIFDEGLANEPGAVREGRQDIARRVFQRLTEIDADNRPGRRIATLAELCALVGVRDGGATQSPSEAGFQPSRLDVEEVLNAFRREGRTFLSPPPLAVDPDLVGRSDDSLLQTSLRAYGEELRDDLVIDISHESLIRNWDLLRDTWLPKEARDAETYTDLSRQTGRWIDFREKHRWKRYDRWYSAPELDHALDWRSQWNSESTAAAWAAPHDEAATESGGFSRAVEFLDKSLRHRTFERRRPWMVAVGIALIGGSVALWQREARLEARAFQRIDLAASQQQSDPLTGMLLLDEVDRRDWLTKFFVGLGWVDRIEVADRGRDVGLAFTEQLVPLSVLEVSGQIRELDFDSTGQELLIVADSGSGRAAYVFDVAQQQIETTFADDNLVLAALGPGTRTMVFDLPASQQPDGWDTVTIAAGWDDVGFNERGTKLFALYSRGDSNRVCLWDQLRDAEWIPRDCRRLERLSGAAFSGDGRQLVFWSQPDGAQTARVYVWEGIARDTAPPIELALPDSGILVDAAYYAEYDSVGAPLVQRLVTGERGVVWASPTRVWDVLQPAPTLSATLVQRHRTLDVAFGPSGDVLAGSVTGVVGRWTPVSDTTCARCGLAPEWTVTAAGRGTRLLAGGLDSGRFLTTSNEDGSAQLWTVGQDEPLELRGHRGGVRLMADAQGANLIATADEANVVRIWDRRGTRWFDTLEAGHPVALNDEGTQLAIARDSAGTPMVQVVDLESRAVRAGPFSAAPPVPFSDMPGIQDVAWSGPFIAFAANSVVLVQDLGGGSLRLPHEDSVVQVGFSRGGSRLLSMTKDRIHVWNSANGQSIGNFGLGPTLVRSAIGPRGSVAIMMEPDSSSTDLYSGIVELWSAVGGEPGANDSLALAASYVIPLGAANGRKATLQDLAFSPDGHTLAIATDLQIRFVRLVEGEWTDAPDTTFKAIEGGARGVAFLDNNQIVTRSMREMHIWDVPTGRRLHTITARYETGRIRSMSVAASGTRVVTVRRERGVEVVQVWPLAFGPLVRALRQSATHACLSVGDRQALLREGPDDAFKEETRCRRQVRDRLQER